MLKETKELCGNYAIVPTRTKGQNFLINETIYGTIIEAAELKRDRAVLEVGPGLGFLTERLAAGAREVVAVELDDKLAQVLKKRLGGSCSNLRIFNQNVLDMDLRTWGIGESGAWQIVANLPYNITSIFLRKVLALKNKPQSLVLMLQKEVAERIVATPGKMSLLAVSVQKFATAEIVVNVPKADFWPAPAVDSAVIKIVTKAGTEEDKAFFRLVKIGFSQKRKMLKNNLASGFHIAPEAAEAWLTRANFAPKIRAQELSLEDWQKLLEVQH